VFFWWEQRVQSAGREPLIAVPMLRNGQLANARIEALRVSLAVLAVLATIGIFMTRLLPTTPAGRRDHDPATGLTRPPLTPHRHSCRVTVDQEAKRDSRFSRRPL
jgi:hypothetical protein